MTVTTKTLQTHTQSLYALIVWNEAMANSKYVVAREEDRRAKISITRCLKELTEIVEEIKSKGEDLGAGSGPYIGGLRLRADIAMKLLNKRLPDLKAIEHSGSIGDKSLEEMNEAELAAELAATRSRIAGDAGKEEKPARPSNVH